MRHTSRLITSLNTSNVVVLGLDCAICLTTSTGTLNKQAAISPKLAATIWDCVEFKYFLFSNSTSLSLDISYVTKKRAAVGALPLKKVKELK